MYLSEGVGTRLTRFKIVESVIDPNAEVDAKYLSTRIVTVDGKAVVGLVVSETKKEVVVFDGDLSLKGELLEVKIVDAKNLTLFAEGINAPAGKLSP